MSKGGVSKHCSINGYLRKVHPELADLLSELCISRILIPRRGSSGVTFLRPDKGLFAEIKKLAHGGKEMEAVKALQSLVLLDFFPQASDFEDKKDDIPTYLRKKLPVSAVTSTKVTLKNVLDKDFKAREDRGEIAVYIISKKLVPTDTEDSKMSHAGKKPKSVKGGAAFKKNRRELFEQVLKAKVEMQRKAVQGTGEPCSDPALEMLVTLGRLIKRDSGEESQEYLAFCSQLGKDTLTTLAILLRPYASKLSGLYISDKVLADLQGLTSGNIASLAMIFAYRVNPMEDYEKMQKDWVALATKRNCLAKLNESRATAGDEAARPTIFSSAERAHKDAQSEDCLGVRQRVLADSRLAIAESELRIMAGLRKDSEPYSSHEDLLELYSSSCKLDSPQITQQQLAKCQITLLYSFGFMLVSSNALVFTPGLECRGQVSDIVRGVQDIDIESGFYGCYKRCAAYYAASRGDLEELFEREGDRFKKESQD